MRSIICKPKPNIIIQGGKVCGTGGAAEAGDFTFAPSINPVSQQLVEGNARVPAHFMDRLRFFEARRREKQHLLRTQMVPAGRPSPASSPTHAMALNHLLR